MEIYENNSIQDYYTVKQWLDDSISRTIHGYSLIQEGSIAEGCHDILLSRVKSAASCALMAVSSVMYTVASVLTTPCFLIPAISLNLASRIPGVSGYEAVQNFTRESSDVIYRIFRVHSVAVPVLTLFVTAAGINTFLPGVLKPQNIFFRSIDWMVECLGPVQTMRVTAPGVITAIGTETELSWLSRVEEEFRALSFQNSPREMLLSSPYRLEYIRFLHAEKYKSLFVSQ